MVPFCYKICYKLVSSDSSRGKPSMPAAFHMSWEPRARRWWKQYLGKRYAVSCRQLTQWAGRPVPETKEGSYQTANAWWLAKKAEIEGLVPLESHPHADDIKEYRKRRDWARKQGLHEEAAWWGRHARAMERGPNNPSVRAGQRDVRRLQFERRMGLPYGALPKTYDPDADVWKDRFARDGAQAVPSERTVGGVVRLYLEHERVRVHGKGLSPSEYDLIRLCLNHFRDWIGAETDIQRVNADTWENYWKHVYQSQVSLEYRKKRFRHARNFIEWAASKGILPAPPNLQHRLYRFGNAAQAIATMTVEEVQGLVAQSSGQLRLHLLLMLNCGMTQIDISELRPSEVDWELGRVIRKRSKTGDLETVPTVNYKLWPSTFALLKQYGHVEGERVLLTERGRPWVSDEIVEGKRRKRDGIHSNYRRLQIKSGIDKPIKRLRKTSASLLDHHREFGRYAPYFLGHTPRSVSARHYVTPSTDLFDAAVSWLGEQYGDVVVSD